MIQAKVRVATPEEVKQITAEMKRLTDLATQRISKMRSSLILTQVFFGALALRLKMVPAWWHSTCAVDGTHLFYNPYFVSELTDAELKGVVCHEVLHCALGHPWRRNERDPKLWNIACDHAINHVVIDAQLKLPADALLDPQYKGMHEELIYAKLLREGGEQGKKKKKGQPGQGQPGQGQPGQGQPGQGQPGAEHITHQGPWGEVLDGESAGEGSVEKESEWQVAAAQAATAAKQQGLLPGGLEGLIAEVMRNKVDWKSALRRFIQSAAKNDYTWRLPSPRYMAQGHYLPSLKSEKLPPIVIMTDSSGSCWDAQESFFAEFAAISGECNPEKVYHCQFDTRIQGDIEEYEPGDKIKMEKRGGGGTDFTNAFDWIIERGIEPCCVIFFTDCYTNYPKPVLDCPVIWASTVLESALPANYKPPFGEFLYIGDDL